MAIEQGTRVNVADKTVRLALEAGLELFNTPEGDTYGRLPRNEHIEVLKLRSKPFRQWLMQLMYVDCEHSIGEQAKEDAIATLEARAYHEGNVEHVYTRIAGHDGKVYLDLVNESWQVVRIDARGWRVLDKSPVNFKRAAGMQALPLPIRDGSIDELRPFVNVGSDEEWVLVLSWLASTFLPNGPYPVLVFSGEAGAAKSTTARVLRELIDPNSVPLRNEPREIRELAIASSNSWVQIFDNLSRVPAWFSDALCTLSTGGGSGARMLYSDDEEKLFSSKRPAILTGIEELATRNDLLDRAILLAPKRIAKYRPESDLWAAFREAQPRILGAVLDAVSHGLSMVGDSTLSGQFRMADFAAWAIACEQGYRLEEGAFLRAYESNQSGANQLALEASPIAQAVLTLFEEDEESEEDTCTEWVGTANQLLQELTTDERTQDRSWPKNGIAMSNALTRIAHNLHEAGITVDKLPRTKGERRIRLSKEA